MTYARNAHEGIYIMVMTVEWNKILFYFYFLVEGKIIRNIVVVVVSALQVRRRKPESRKEEDESYVYRRGEGQNRNLRW